MKKVYLSILGFSFLCRMNAYAQAKHDTVSIKPAYTINGTPRKDSTHYNSRKFQIDEIDFVSSYYSQNGNHSAVTGGIGTEKVTDIANGLTLNFVKTDRNLNKHAPGRFRF